MPPPTQRWIATVSDGERPDRQRQVEIAVRVDPPERTHRCAPADRLERGDLVDRRDLRRTRDRATRERRARISARPRPGAAAPRRWRRGASRRPAPAAPSAPASGSIPASHTRERSFRSRSTIITCSAASFTSSMSSPRRPRALDRHRPQQVAAPGEKELGRRGDDRPARRRRAAAGAAAEAVRARPRAPAGSPSNGAERCWTRFTW